MKIKFIGKSLAIVRGKPHELKPLEFLCDGTHHVHKNPTGRRDKPETCGTCKHWHRNANPIRPEGLCKIGLVKDTNIYDTCDNWEAK